MDGYVRALALWALHGHQQDLRADGDESRGVVLPTARSPRSSSTWTPSRRCPPTRAANTAWAARCNTGLDLPPDAFGNFPSARRSRSTSHQFPEHRVRPPEASGGSASRASGVGEAECKDEWKKGTPRSSSTIRAARRRSARSSAACGTCRRTCAPRSPGLGEDVRLPVRAAPCERHARRDRPLRQAAAAVARAAAPVAVAAPTIWSGE